MQLTYIFHSGFVISGHGFSILIDYWRDTKSSKEGYVHEHFLQSTGKLYVLSSHAHPDHFNPEILTWSEKRPDIQYIFSSDILATIKNTSKTPEIFYLDKTEVYTDNYIQVKAFGSTDIGISFAIEAEGKSIFHAGDFNNWHWNEESTEEEIRTAETSFLRKLKILAKAYPKFDLVMFPVDPRLGKDYMRGAEQFVQTIKTATFAPMHFGFSYNEANAFKTVAEAHGTRFLSIQKCGENIEF
jgi:L-ascorbate metabolism protein UlaG (beta-lactamase superfamily)